MILFHFLKCLICFYLIFWSFSYDQVSSRKSYESSCIDIVQWTRALKQTKEKQTKNILKYFLFCCSIRFKNRFIERNMKENLKARLQIKMYSFLLLICDFVLISLFIHRSFIHLDLNAWSRKTSIQKMKESLFWKVFWTPFFKQSSRFGWRRIQDGGVSCGYCQVLQSSRKASQSA